MGQNETRIWTAGFSHGFHLPGQAIEALVLNSEAFAPESGLEPRSVLIKATACAMRSQHWQDSVPSHLTTETRPLQHITKA